MTRGTHKLARILLALTLVAAQFLAQAHGFSHLRTSSDPFHSTGSQTQPCSECLSVAPLLAAASAPVLPIAFLHVAMEAHGDLCRAAVASHCRHRPFQSRAPPS